MTYSLFLKSILDAAGAADRINDVLRYRAINVVMSVWNPGFEVAIDDVENRLGFKMSKQLTEYVGRIINTIKASEVAYAGSCLKDLFYFSEIARSIEDERQAPRTNLYAGSDC